MEKEELLYKPAQLNNFDEVCHASGSPVAMHFSQQEWANSQQEQKWCAITLQGTRVKLLQLCKCNRKCYATLHYL